MNTDFAELQNLFNQATLANARTLGRRGSTVYLDPAIASDVIFTGDLHGRLDNFHKLIDVADLENHTRRHLVLQEACHGGPPFPDGSCASHLLILEILQLIIRYPGRVHFVLGNHELAEMTNLPIVKRGKLLNHSFKNGLIFKYGDLALPIHNMMVHWFWTCPLAVRWKEQVLFTHSIPEKCYARETGFDFSIFDRYFETADIAETGSVHKLLWGRDFSEPNSQYFALRMHGNILINGHEPCLSEGYKTLNGRQIILDCCDDNPAYIQIDQRTLLDFKSLISAICYL